ncbi:MAG: 5'/3'-nucleotidase SurE [Thermaerobacter sp.]|nr:5'/3'-nucleotidase SurE [Thermaerobacter sp.]
MRILLTNDDGIDAPGIQALREVLNPEHELLLAAPSEQRSASGHAITMGRPLLARHYRYASASEGWGIDGTPADCVRIGLELMGDVRPDLLISGINFGANLGRDVFYSGTVSAAVEGTLMGVPSIAVSLASPDPAGFEWTARFIRWWIRFGEFCKPPAGVVYNVNVPSLRTRLPSAIRSVKLGQREYVNHCRRSDDTGDQAYFWLTGRVSERREPDDTDVGAHQLGYITLTPLHLDWTAYPVLRAEDLCGPLQQLPDGAF